MLQFYYSARRNRPGALIVDNVEERFNYRNKERVGEEAKRSEENAFVLEMMERFSLIIVTRIQFIKRVVKA